ncbi:hypothetical protein FOA52_011602 [Chlamydomonas sp. UWO 241]|nr:hypothetical protein FOA52_011602 [Chlamydomonas sp. UWO 241]
MMENPGAWTFNSSAEWLDVNHLREVSDMSWVREYKKCSGGCEEVFAEFMEHPRWSCEGSPEIFDGGSWIGHVWPATIFLIWGLHWLQGLVVQYYRGAQGGEPYVARSYYQLWVIPEMVESWFKFVLPWFCILLELYLGYSPPTLKTMTCPSGTLLAGHLLGSHMGNWQHAFMYPGFIASGFADLFSHRVTAVPKGVTHGTPGA